MAWDYEARSAAYDQSRAMAARDPDAAAYLMAHLDVTAADAPSITSAHEPYDPMMLYARMAKYYRFSDSDLDNMAYPRFFGYLRCAVLMSEEEQRAIDRQTNAPPPAVPDDWSS